MANPSIPYETGMRITYDSRTKKVTVTFRGRIAVLDGSYQSEHEAISAGEMHCRQLGWQPEAAKAKTGVSMMRRR